MSLVAVALGAGLVSARTIAPDLRQGQPSGGKGRVVAVADIHGDLDAFVGILQTAGLIDARRQWIGGRATFVQTGDFLDRGAAVRGVMDLMMDLEPQAERAGGKVLVLLGNHEGMNLIHEFRDVSPEAFATFADEKSEERREAAYEEYSTWISTLSRDRRLVRARIAAPTRMPKKMWLQKHPPGYFEYADELGTRGRYGAWLRKKDAAARLNGTLFVHGGVHPDFSPEKFEDLNRDVRDEIKRFDEIRQIFTDGRLATSWFTLEELLDVVNREMAIMKAERRQGPRPPAGIDEVREFQAVVDLAQIDRWNLLDQNSPLWFRGFALWTEEEGTPIVTKLLQQYGADHFAVGHTVVNRLGTRFGGRVFVMDTGMLSSVYKGGRASALEIENGRFTAIYTDRRQVIWITEPSAVDARSAP